MITYGGNAELSYGAFVFLVSFLVAVLCAVIVRAIWKRDARQQDQ